MNTAIPCPDCHGRRYIGEFLCGRCNGNGSIASLPPISFGQAIGDIVIGMILGAIVAAVIWFSGR